MSNDPPLQSGRTKAIDLNDFDRSQKQKKSADDGWQVESWGDPWGGEEQKVRKWADDERWAGDDDVKTDYSSSGGGDSNRTKALDLSEFQQPEEEEEDLDDWGVPKGNARGWSAPKRDEVLASGGGWDDWNDDGGQSTMAMKLDDLEEQKELGGRRKKQAAASYDKADQSAYGAGKARRQEIYKAKEDSDFEGGYMSYEGGRRETYGQQVGTSDDGWSYDPDAGRAPEPMPSGPPPGQVLEPEERTVALDLGAGGEEFQRALAEDAQGSGFEASPSYDSGAGFGADDFGPPSPAARPVPGQPTADTGPSNGALVIFTPNAPAVVYELPRGTTSVGRGLENNVVLSDPYSSRQHLVVTCQGDAFEVQDGGTDNGTSVNGHPISHAMLRPGDHIEIGNTILRFVLGPVDQQALLFGPPPPVPPHHLAQPPQMPSVPQMAMHPPKSSNKGLVIALAVLILLVLGGGATAAIYVFAFSGETKSTKSEPEETTADMNTGYQPGASGAETARVAEAMDEHDRVMEEGVNPDTENPSIPTHPAEANTPEVPSAPATPEADPILVASLVGSAAMATGQNKPLTVTTAGETVRLKIYSDPADALLFDATGVEVGRTPYEVTEIKGDRIEEWRIKKSGFNEQAVKVDFSNGVDESFTLGKVKAKPKAKKKKKKKKKKDRNRGRSKRRVTIVD